MTITEHTTVAEVAAAVPSSVRVFQRYGIDFCCGGRKPIGVACEELALPAGEVIAAIQAADVTPAPDVRDWTREPLAALADHIVAAYHEPLRDELPRLETMAARVAQVHGSNAPFLKRVEAIVSELADDLGSHMEREEAVLFPAIRDAERTGTVAAAVSGPIAVMEQEHDRAGELLAEMREITGGYAAPDWACQTFRSLYYGLRSLEKSMHVHVHLENNVLFPRALQADSTDTGTCS